jgi:4'-phosphopantetheinyl transferase EntD
MIQEIVPDGVFVGESFGDLPEVVLPAEEEALISAAVETRRREFRTTRACARAALAALGHPPGPILRGPRGAPSWPAGVVGSMTHCPGYRAAAVADAGAFTALGIDAEVHAPLPPGVLDVVALPTERDRLDELARDASPTAWDRILFSAKESVYKAWFPLAQRMLDFVEADVTIGPDGAFAARLLVAGPVVAGAPLTGFTGRWLVRDGLVLTAIARPHPATIDRTVVSVAPARERTQSR